MADLRTDLAPYFALVVDGTVLKQDISEFVQGIFYEECVDRMAVMEVIVANKDFAMSDGPVFNPGNTVDLYLGYGGETGAKDFVGRAEIIRHIPDFPDDGVPTLAIHGYDHSWRLSHQELKITGGNLPKKVAEEAGRPWQGTVGSILTEILAKHGIVADVDPLIADDTEAFVQPKGMSDMAVIRALANFMSAWFWVSWVPDAKFALGPLAWTAPGHWIGHFRVPGKIEQPNKHTFKWAQGNDSTLFNVQLEFAIDETVTEVKATVWDREQKLWIPIFESGEVAFSKKGKKTFPKMQASATTIQGGGGVPAAWAAGLADTAGEIGTVAVKLETSGYAVDILNTPFKDVDQATRALSAWMQENRNAFLIAEGSIPGRATVRAGQTHRLEGLGVRYSGDYYFATVRHRWNPGSGYTTEFVGRKIVV